jgi:hypothetical protein
VKTAGAGVAEWASRFAACAAGSAVRITGTAARAVRFVA